MRPGTRTKLDAAHSVQAASDRLATKRIIMLDQPADLHEVQRNPRRFRTVPPSPEEFWSRTWFALYTAPGQEWRARVELARQGYAIFLPVRVYWNSSRFRVRRQLEQSLLTRYEFVGVRGRGIGIDDWSAILRTDGVLALLGDPRGPVQVPRENLIALAGHIVAGAFDETKDVFSAGDAARILRGPFTGFTGQIEAAVGRDVGPDDAVAVVCRLMGRDTILHLPLADLAKIE